MTTPAQTATYWISQLQSALENEGLAYRLVHKDGFILLAIHTDQLFLNLVPLNNNFEVDQLIQLQQSYFLQQKRCIHLWEDVWLNRSLQVLARIKSLLGDNIRIHGRKTSVIKLDKPVADKFLNENHLQGTVSSRYKLGLFAKDNLVAVATFSALRRMNHSENYKSAELIRFAVQAGHSVTGGLSKLLKHFEAQYQPNDIMSYADRDWSAGEAYEKLNFKFINAIAPQYFCLDDEGNRKLKKDACVSGKEVFNTGSLKFIWRCDEGRL
ncbi:hypothetical protein [Pedobacter sp. BMA]|uniref:hypothetical protein n=1 Tax=Pedobacter sp. BMA TaxID=1663685 RepID=UPI00064B49D2|nr:hypothetical protein [Pedobacter sp. BMA]KLT64176.1 hypothetical protein AB669_16520 [Pedobacter sp. BMA]